MKEIVLVTSQNMNLLCCCVVILKNNKLIIIMIIIIIVEIVIFYRYIQCRDVPFSKTWEKTISIQPKQQTNEKDILC